MIHSHPVSHQMASKNDSSQVSSCLNQDFAKDSRAGFQRHDEGFRTEATNSRQKPGAEAQPGGTWGEEKLKREPECHMQLDKLHPNRNHTVLIDVRAFTLI